MGMTLSVVLVPVDLWDNDKNSSWEVKITNGLPPLEQYAGSIAKNTFLADPDNHQIIANTIWKHVNVHPENLCHHNMQVHVVVGSWQWIQENQSTWVFPNLKVTQETFNQVRDQIQATDALAITLRGVSGNPQLFLLETQKKLE
jgi:hypothetical protein